MADLEEKEKPAIEPTNEEEKRNMNYPIVRYSEIPEDTKVEILDTITAAVDRYVTDLEMACQAIKEEMDRLYEPTWHVAIGEGFGYDVTYQTQHIMYMFYMGNLGVLVWKCG